MSTVHLSLFSVIMSTTKKMKMPLNRIRAIKP